MLLPQELRSPIDLGSARHLGEDPEGTWTLTVKDPSLPDDGTLKGWSLTIRGHGLKPRHPAIASVGPGNTYLTIGWMAPEDIGASAITSYDLRYIRSDATDRADEYWTPKMRIWSAGDLVYELSGLTLDVGYDVQVRAVNSAGAGPWSEVAQGQTMTAPPGAPAIDSVVAGDGEFTVSWSAPARNGGAEITRYDVRYIEEDETDRADSNWDVETAWNTGDGALEHTVSSIDNDLGYDIEVRAANSEGAGAWSATAILRRNQSPRFPSTETGLRSVDENTLPRRAVGAPVAATDEEDDTLTYSLAESGAAFSIDAGTGQLRTKDALNHEAADSRTVTVQVSDGKNARGDTSTAVDATIVVTVTVNDINEQPRADTDQVSTLEDERVMIDVLSNDFDPDDGDTLTVSITRRPSPGGVVVDPTTQMVTYTPAENEHGTYTFTYTASDDDPDRRLTSQPHPGHGHRRRGERRAHVRAVAPGPPRVRERRCWRHRWRRDGNGRRGRHAHVQPLRRRRVFVRGSIRRSGQITVAANVTPLSPFDIATQEIYTVTVDRRLTAAGDGTATVEVTITVGGSAYIPPPSGGGGGFVRRRRWRRRRRRRPQPSVIDFEWTVTRDIEELDSGHDKPSGLWSDGTTLWLARERRRHGRRHLRLRRQDRRARRGPRVRARRGQPRAARRLVRRLHRLGLRQRPQPPLRPRPRERRAPRGARHRTRRPQPRRARHLVRRRDDVGAGRWEGQPLRLRPRERRAARRVRARLRQRRPARPLVDGVTVWVSDHGREAALRLPPAGKAGSAVRPRTRNRRPSSASIDEEFTELSKASNNSPRGLWSDGDVMYVADASDAKVYSYNMPDAIDARLVVALAQRRRHRGVLAEPRSEYQGAAGERCDADHGQRLEATQRRTERHHRSRPTSTRLPTGHQVALEDLTEITVTVTSENGSRTRVYRVAFPADSAAPSEQAPAASCLGGDVAVGFSLVTYGGGSVEDLEACAQARNVTALYALDGGEYVSYILGAPAFVNADFRALFADGVPALTPLTVKSEGPPSPDPSGGESRPGDATQPWPACLQGEIVEGFSLVVYEGGSVDDLVACAEGVGLAAVYALNDGIWVSYILGAPEFVNAAFRELFTDGVPVATPLVGKSD